MTLNSRSSVWVGVAALIGLGISQAPAEADPIRGCRNPAGQVRLIGETEACKSQETLVTWNEAGPTGPQGAKGDPGADAPGVTGGADRGPIPPNTPAFLSGTPFSLTTDNLATGFSAYMVWANVAVEFNTGNPAAGTGPSPSSANCAIVYTVNGGPTAFVDGRSVAFPVASIGDTDKVVRLNIGLNGMIGTNLPTPIGPLDLVNISLNCSSNAGPVPPPGPVPVPVKAVSYSLSGIGINKGFEQP